jgi:hypothetical protein
MKRPTACPDGSSFAHRVEVYYPADRAGHFVGQPVCLPKRRPKKVIPPTRQVLHITYSLTILFNLATITTRQLR